ncbi:MAG: DUF4157 domain-containing protein [Gallionella sp.]|nr:DUF4157 domain-containing protein [Gallionella sp.]
MQKAEAQHSQQGQSVVRQGKGTALESPQGERIAQLEAMVDASPQAGRLAQFAAMANDSPAVAAQRKLIGQIHNDPAMAAQRADAHAKPNNTGLPDNLKSGIESLSGMSMDNVKVHYNSSQPAQLNALAYAQGTDIHVAPGQEKHLPHEAWHVVQQAQGRVRPTMQMKDGVPVNDDTGLEREADVMGAKAIAQRMEYALAPMSLAQVAISSTQVQRITFTDNAAGLPAVPIVIAALDDNECRTHLQREGRMSAGHPQPGDADYAYAPGDRALIQQRQVDLRNLRLAAVVADLDNQRTVLATAADHAVQPVWNGNNPVQGASAEVAGGAVLPNAAVAAWQAFLGAGPYSQKHPRTGLVDATRLVSSDGLRSIRYGAHEMTSSANLHHYHEETWTYNVGANAVDVANTIRRVPVQ